MTSTLGQQGGDSEKTLSKLPNKKSKQTLAGLKGREKLRGFNDRGAGWKIVRQQVLYFAELS